MRRVFLMSFLCVSGFTTIKETKGTNQTDIYHPDMPEQHVKNPLLLPSVPVGWDTKDYKMNFRESLNFKLRRAPIPTIGSPWPKPQKYLINDSTKLFRLQRDKLGLRITRSDDCQTLQDAVQRYLDYIFTCFNDNYENNLRNVFDEDLRKKMLLSPELSVRDTILITSLIIHLKSCSYWPDLASKESYQLTVNTDGIHIVAEDVWGALRGLETLSQLVFCSRNTVLIRDTKIEDFPRFIHRGILVDTARHYIKKETIFQIMRGMEMNKLNVFHWHMTDDQSFPFQSKYFPELSEKGAFHPTLVYTHTDVKDIIEFGRQRGIRVIPEFDVPAHVLSWSFGKPELLTRCYGSGKVIPGLLGPLNPARNSTYSLLQELYREILNLFQDQLVHIGGDEVPFECWKSNDEVAMFAKELGKIKNTSSDMKDVLKYFTKRFVSGIEEEVLKSKRKRRLVVWEESFRSNLPLPKNTVVQLWFSGSEYVPKVAQRNFSVIFSSCWYIDQVKPGSWWHAFYNCDPEGPKQSPNVLGGEVCAWGEHIANEDVLVKMWPLTSAAAERLWSEKNVRNIEEAAPRLEEHRCRMLRRNIPVGSASGPGFCITEGYSDEKKPRHQVLSEEIFRYMPLISPVNEKYLVNLTTLIFCIGLLGFIVLFKKSRRTLPDHKP